MVTRDDIKHLGDLARMEVSDSEIESLTEKIDSILGYVGQIKDATFGSADDVSEVVPVLHNVMREDVVTYTDRQYTESILANAPAREGDYVKVKKIL